MKLIIDIPEEVKQTFDNAKNEDLYGNYYDYNSLIGKAIQNGTPLPKGHGRIIDESKIAIIIETEDGDDFITDAPTIIEADKAESEDEE